VIEATHHKALLKQGLWNQNIGFTGIEKSFNNRNCKNSYIRAILDFFKIIYIYSYRGWPVFAFTLYIFLKSANLLF